MYKYIYTILYFIPFMYSDCNHFNKHLSMHMIQVYFVVILQH